MRSNIVIKVVFLGSMAMAAVLAALPFGEPAQAVPTPTDRPMPSDPVSDKERAYLPALHRAVVEIFVDRPFFGVRRTLVTRIDQLVLPPKADTDDTAKKETAPPPAKKDGKEKDAHFRFQDLIAQHHKAFPAEGTGVWQLRKVQLVGLIKHPKPVVYDSDKVPGMKDNEDVPTRELDAFEKAALDDLRKGEAIRVERHGNDMRVMGPIYAGKQCTACHEKTGQLLGGFSYVLERTVPKAK